MLIWGTANPTGIEDATYDGLYLTDKDVDDMAECMTGKPVKVEHKVNTHTCTHTHNHSSVERPVI
jgi:hypothetical protein